MKILNHILLIIVAAFVVISCNEGIDPITKVDPGADESAPQISIVYPVEGTQIKIAESIATITIQFEVTDDIELGTISVKMDGTQLATYNEFIDYRRFVGEIVYDQVTIGQHTLTIETADLEGKKTTQSVNFDKVSAYDPLYNGEIFFMPFDGDYMDLISIKTATAIGTPGFAGEGVLGNNAYKGATDSYLSFPAADLMSNEFSAVMWIKVNAVPDRAGILVLGPEDTANPGAENLRTSGFRLFREGSAAEQRFKLNVGTGAGETWNDGGTVNPALNQWVHLAFTISETSCIIYINGVLALESAMASPISWEGCNDLSIMSGAPHFNGWNHLADLSYLDELRLFNRALSLSEIQNIMTRESGIVPGYEPKFDGEIFYLPLDGDLNEMVGDKTITPVGTPGFAGEGFVGGNSYMGVADSYLEVSTEGLLNDEFSATFWYKVNPDPNRAGILIIGPEDTANPAAQNVRTSGFRFFREGGATSQIFKLNGGSGDAESWFDGGAAATVDPALNEWVHMAFTISGTECVVYFDGEIVSQGVFPGIDWTGCDILTIGSGAPRFTGWEHFSDLSFLDELRLYNKALTQDEVKAVMNADL